MSFELGGVPRNYAWGSMTAIQQLLGRPVDGGRIAELWFGAHPGAPSPVPQRGTTLDAVIATAPEALLGHRVVDRFGPQLPFLLKILAADSALSIQVHPTSQQARAGFAREQAAGIALDAPNRNYRDPNHKPELLCALTPFTALCGFRSPTATLALLQELDVAELAFLADRLRGPDPLRTAFRAVLELAEPEPVVDALTCRIDGAQEDALRAVQLAATDFPGDAGVLLALLLNPVVLAPGEAIYLGAGNVHAYLRGTGIEIMANSDNVLRCGLTQKHIDVAAVLETADFRPLDEPRYPDTGGHFAVPVPDFALTRLVIDEPTGLDDPGPSIVLCAEGRIGVGELALLPGRAAFVPAGEHTTIGGRGLAFIATSG